MVWRIDRTYSFTISRLLEGFLDIQTLTISAGGWSWDLIIGSVDQGITPGIHPGDVVSINMVVRNAGAIVDTFMVRTTVGASPPEESGIMTLAIGATDTWSPSTFVMPDADVNTLIETFHYEPD